MKENAFKGESAAQNPLASLPVKSLMLKIGIPMILSIGVFFDDSGLVFGKFRMACLADLPFCGGSFIRGGGYFIPATGLSCKESIWTPYSLF